MDKTRFIEMLTVPDGWNGHTVCCGIVYDYQAGSVVLVHPSGCWHSLSQAQLDYYRKGAKHP